MALGDENWNDRRVTGRKSNRVLAILRQIEDLRYSDFTELASYLKTDPEGLNGMINHGLAMIESDDEKSGNVETKRKIVDGHMAEDKSARAFR